jgi:hypothetical protein
LRLSAMAPGEHLAWIRADLRVAVRHGGSISPGSGVGRDQRIVGRSVLFLAVYAAPSTIQFPQSSPIAASDGWTHWDGSSRGLRLRRVGTIANQPIIAAGGTHATRRPVLFIVRDVLGRDT